MEIKLTRKRALYLLIFISFMVILTTTFSSCHTFTENFGPFKDIFKKKNVGVTSLNKNWPVIKSQKIFISLTASRSMLPEKSSKPMYANNSQSPNKGHTLSGFGC